MQKRIQDLENTRAYDSNLGDLNVKFDAFVAHLGWVGKYTTPSAGYEFTRKKKPKRSP
jgi:hypothetical protein